MEPSGLKSITDVKLGKNVYIANFVNLYGCSLGDDCKVGAFVEIQRGVKIGNKCKISSHTFICEGVRIGNGVFIGHNVSFVNDLYPRSTNTDGSLKTSGEWTLSETIVEDGASIGTGSTILCGITIGKNSMIGAGSVVTKDVPPGTTVCGNPAKCKIACKKEC